MKDELSEIEKLRRENEGLRAQLEAFRESHETLRAIHEGEVDALVVSGPEGDRIFTLQGAEHAYRVLIEQMQEGAVTLLADGTIRYCNGRFAEMVRRPLEKVIGTRLDLYIDEPDRPAFNALVRQALAGSARGDVSLRPDGGPLLPVDLGLSPLVDGTDPSIAIVVIDLRERRRAEAMLASEQFTRRLIDNAPIGVAVVGRDLRYILANPAYQAIAEAPVVGRTIAEVFPPAVARMVQPFVEQTLQSGQPMEFRELEAPIRGQSWWNVNLVPLRGAAGNTESVLILTQEVTEQRRAEEALAAAHQQMQSLINNAPAIVYAFDLGGRFVLANTALAGLLNSTPEQMMGRRRHEFMPREDADWHEANDRQVIEAGRALEFEERSQLQGRSITWLTTKFPLRDGQGSIYAVAGISTDVSERKRMEGDLMAARDSAENAKAEAERWAHDAENASKAKDHFLAVLSHELRTPLSAVIPALDTLAASVSGQAAENLELARRNVELEARLIDDLLDVTRISRGKIELDRKPVVLCTIVRRAAEVCMPDIEARQLHFNIEAECDPACWVEGDPARLQQVFWNLVKNAVKFTPRGGCVAVRVRAADGIGEIEVVDSGHGIEADHLPMLFNAFEQAERSITRQFGGLGLGLAISKALVELHGGTIEARSEGRNKGATFTVRLPLLSGEQARPGRPEAPARDRPSRPLRILLVEDHGDTARMMRQLLRGDGHEVKHAGDVATAMAMAMAEPFDVLLSDLGLPDGTGHQLLRELRTRGVKLKAIALSGYGMAADVQKSRDAGFDEHVTKPINFDTLQQALNRVCGR